MRVDPFSYVLVKFIASLYHYIMDTIDDMLVGDDPLPSDSKECERRQH
jgi:hypothetical protein